MTAGFRFQLSDGPLELRLVFPSVFVFGCVCVGACACVRV